MKIFLPDYAVRCLEAIESAGFEAWAVGGCVRDALLGLSGGDIDIASSASPEEIKSIFSKVHDTGIKHGTVTVVVEGHSLEVTQFRSDGDYSDGRHPDSVLPVLSISEDLARRDFTVNAMAYSPEKGLIDLYGGAEDLRAGVIRCVGDPVKRFCEDALRIMRAFRFASKLGFSIEKNTFEAALSLAGRLSNVSRERICRELYLTLCGKRPAVAGDLINTGALKHIGLMTVKKDLSVLNGVPADEGCVFAALAMLCDTDAEKLCMNLKTSKKTRVNAVSCLAELKMSLPESSYEIKKRMRVFGNIYPLCLKLRSAVLGDDTSNCEKMFTNIMSAGEPFDIHMLAVSGNDIAAFGISGKKVGQELERFLDLVIKDPKLNTREKLLSLL